MLKPAASQRATTVAMATEEAAGEVTGETGSTYKAAEETAAGSEEEVVAPSKDICQGTRHRNKDAENVELINCKPSTLQRAACLGAASL
jgi:hypothetical protein